MEGINAIDDRNAPASPRNDNPIAQPATVMTGCISAPYFNRGILETHRIDEETGTDAHFRRMSEDSCRFQSCGFDSSLKMVGCPGSSAYPCSFALSHYT